MIVMIALMSVYSKNIQYNILLPTSINAGIVLFLSQLITLFFFLSVINNFFQEKIPFCNILKFKYLHFLEGIVIAISALIVMDLIFIGLGIQNYHINETSLNYLSKGLLLSILIGVKEEVLFRGFLLVSLKERYSKITAITISSILFGLVHAFNSEFDLVDFLEIVLVGIFLCFAFFKYNNLWLPIGFHSGWNFFLFFIYSTNENNISAPFISGQNLINSSLIGLLEITFIIAMLILYFVFSGLRDKLYPAKNV